MLIETNQSKGLSNTEMIVECVGSEFHDVLFLLVSSFGRHYEAIDVEIGVKLKKIWNE